MVARSDDHMIAIPYNRMIIVVIMDILLVLMMRMPPGLELLGCLLAFMLMRMHVQITR